MPRPRKRYKKTLLGDGAATSTTESIMELPDDVLSLVVSKLKYRDAVRTTVLSRPWIHFFPTLHDFKFDAVSMSLPGSQDEREFRKKPRELCVHPCKDEFLTGVDQFLLQFCQPSHMGSFEISFCLGDDRAHHLDRFVRFAVQKGVQKLKLLLCCAHPCCNRRKEYKDNHYYVFRSTLLDVANTSLEELRLSRCVLVSEPNLSHPFFQLRTLSLQQVSLHECDLQSMLSCMAKLQYLKLTRCALRKFEELDLTSLSLLERLKFIFCWGLKKIKLPEAKELLDFECVNKEAVTFDLRGFRKLRNLHYSVHKSGLYNVYAYLPAVLPPTLRTVTVSIYTNNNWAIQLPRNITTFTGVTHLTLEFRGHTTFCFSSLRFFPCVERLSLCLHTFTYGDQAQIGNFKAGTYAPEHLKKVIIYACDPYRNTKFITKLLGHAYKLERLIVIRKFGCGRCTNKWSWEKGERRRILELLQGISKNISMIVGSTNAMFY